MPARQTAPKTISIFLCVFIYTNNNKIKSYTQKNVSKLFTESFSNNNILTTNYPTEQLS